MHWAFLRRYSEDTRVEFPVHRDTSSFTVNVLLSEPGRDFLGADLYALPDSTCADQITVAEFRKRFGAETLRRTGAIVRQEPGACVIHPGRRLHGVLPIEKGQRITLILMYLDNV
ncbi:unnamed protein product [Amoebophrya sp. A25]|nr:unnamed protein product [Amoebophrya sp. A25]|eukprot:GSA25T00008002001.1